MKTMIILIFALFFSAHGAFAQATAPVKLIFLNECPDVPPEGFIKPTTPEEWLARRKLWECHNRTQASQRQETFEKVWAASYNTKLKKPTTICSVDPKIKYENGEAAEWRFGAWKSKRKGCDIDYADMPGCPNARRDLERLLRRMGNSVRVRK